MKFFEIKEVCGFFNFLMQPYPKEKYLYLRLLRFWIKNQNHQRLEIEMGLQKHGKIFRLDDL